MATIEDVARRAGVSTATVSRALSGSNAPVREATRRRILEAVDELGYHPSALPSYLRARSSRSLGLVITDIGNPFFPAVARGVEDVARSAGFGLVLTNTDEDAELERDALLTLLGERVGGVILASTGRTNQGLDRLVAAGIPVVALDRRIEGVDVDSVMVDNVSAAQAATEHLLALGHRRIGFIGGPSYVSTAADRYVGYRQAFERRGLPVVDDLVRTGDLRDRGGFEQGMALLTADQPPTAIFSVNGQTTVGLLRACRASDRRLPDEVSLVGFDDLPTGELLDPPLTAVVQPSYRLGQVAAELLLARRDDPDREVVHEVLEADLVVRGSSGPPASVDGPRGQLSRDGTAIGPPRDVRDG
jgi:LacI family transcriptional regulator